MLFRFVWRYLRTRLLEVIGIIVLQVIATIAALNLPSLNARIIDEGVAQGDTDLIWKLGAIMMGITLVQVVTTAFAVYFGARTAMGLGAWARHRLFTHVQSFSAQNMHDFGAPSLITRSTNDVQQIQMVTLMTFLIMVQAPINGIGGVLMAVRQNQRLSLLLLVVVPILAVVVGIIMAFLASQFARLQKRIDTMNTVLREELTGIRVIRAFVRQPFIRERYDSVNASVRSVYLRIGILFSIMFPSVTLIISMSSVAVVWFGGSLIDSGNMQIGALFAFINYLGMIFMAVMMAAMMFVMVPRAGVAAHRVTEVLDAAPTVVTPAEAQSPSNMATHIDEGDAAASEDSHHDTTLDQGQWVFSLDHVSVHYDGALSPVLDDISITLKPGTTTAIIGSTASGKTTLVNLLPRLMDPTGGTIRVNGVDARDIDLAQLRQRIAMVPQHAYLFSGTIAQTVSGLLDVTRTDNLTDEQLSRVERALEGAQATEFVSKLDGGVNYDVDPGGSNFSGGQRQRLSIARALYRDADLYIFDDSFSALDYATDARLRAGLSDHTGNAAIVVVAQRVASIRHADTIIVLEDGHIAGRGTHEDLMKSCTTYQEIVASQLSEEEAA